MLILETRATLHTVSLKEIAERLGSLVDQCGNSTEMSAFAAMMEAVKEGEKAIAGTVAIKKRVAVYERQKYFYPGTDAGALRHAHDGPRPRASHASHSGCSASSPTGSSYSGAGERWGGGAAAGLQQQ